MTIAIYGGTFNPPHIGHTSLAKSIVSQGLVDEVWLLVSPLNPFKQAQTSEFAPYDDRLKMTQLAVSRMKGLRASDFENHLPIPSYMITTLNELSKAYPEHEFCLVIGADNWERFAQWYHSEEIIEKYQILVYRRPGYELNVDTTIYPRVKVVDTPLFDISSTEIREAIRRGEEPQEWVSPKVLKYMKEKNLYLNKAENGGEQDK